MKVVLLQDVKNIGKKDEMHEVSDGYGRNYLLPRGLAIEANAAAMNEVKQKQDAKRHREEEQHAAAAEVAGKLDGQTVVVRARGGASGRLFGAVTVKDIAAQLAAQGLEVDKRKLSTNVREIKDYGDYTVEAKIAAGVSATFTVSVVPAE